MGEKGIAACQEDAFKFRWRLYQAVLGYSCLPRLSFSCFALARALALLSGIMHAPHSALDLLCLLVDWELKPLSTQACTSLSALTLAFVPAVWNSLVLVALCLIRRSVVCFVPLLACLVKNLFATVSQFSHS